MKSFKVILSIFLSSSFIAAMGCNKPHSSLSQEYPKEVTALATEGGVGLPYYIGKDLRPAWKIENEARIRSLNEFRLIDQKGKEISSKNLDGKITIVSFFYSECPGICPMTTENLKAVQKKFKNDDRIVMLSFSVTPQVDTPQKLTRFAKKFDVSYRRWKLVTGNREKIYKLARESFGADTISENENALMKLKPEDFLHSENVYLLDGKQKLRGIYAARMVSSLEELTRDAKTLLQ